MIGSLLRNLPQKSHTLVSRALNVHTFSKGRHVTEYVQGSIRTFPFWPGQAPGPQCSFCPRALARGFSSSTADKRSEAALEEEAGKRFVNAVRFTVVCMLLGMAIKVFPTLGRNSPDQVLSLMSADGPIFKKTGMHRAKALAREDGPAQQLVDKGVARLLTNALDETEDKEVATVGLELMEELCAHSAAREAFLLAGTKEVLEKVAALGGDNGILARQLLVVLTIQEKHIE